jgi:hypothetical protein
MMRSVTTALTAALLATAAAFAEPVFNDDFQDGDAQGWGASGEGDVRLTTYDGNVAMRLSDRAAAFAAVTTEGYDRVRISAAFAADDLEQGEACLFEASADDGASWLEVLRVSDGQDDAAHSPCRFVDRRQSGRRRPRNLAGEGPGKFR